MRAKGESMKPIRIAALTPEQLDDLEKLYRTTRDARLRTRAQMVLLAAERRLTAAQIAGIVRASEETVRRWLKRYLAEGVEGLRDEPHPGAPRKVTQEYVERLIHAVKDDFARRLNLRRDPEIYLMSGNGTLNAFAASTFGYDFVVIHSELFSNTYEKNKDALAFIIGHELGHLRLEQFS